MQISIIRYQDIQLHYFLFHVFLIKQNLLHLNKPIFHNTYNNEIFIKADVSRLTGLCPDVTCCCEAGGRAESLTVKALDPLPPFISLASNIKHAVGETKYQNTVLGQSRTEQTRSLLPSSGHKHRL